MFEITSVDIENDGLINSYHDEIDLLDTEYVLEVLNNDSDYSDIASFVAEYDKERDLILIYGIAGRDQKLFVDDTTYLELILLDSDIHSNRFARGLQSIHTYRELEKDPFNHNLQNKFMFTNFIGQEM